MRIVLGVSGGIAAYKTPDLVRRLQESGAEVRVIMTANATRFVAPLSLAAVSTFPVISDQWGDASRGGVDHVELARWAELLLIAPATANVIAKTAVGIADDALTTFVVAHRGTTVMAPAMNTFMLRNPVVGENLERLRQRGIDVIEPDSGLLACGDEGEGRMPDATVIVDRVSTFFAPRDLEDRGVLITAGPTREAIDPVRFLSNRSSGRMGFALADRARRRGAKVILVSGPVSIPDPQGVEVVRVTTAAEMLEAVEVRIGNMDVLIGAAAVADYRPVNAATDSKLKKDSAEHLDLRLERTADIVGTIGRRDQRPFIVAFAAETNNLEGYAKRKLEEKNADMIVANDVSDRSIGFDSDSNAVVILSRGGGRLPVGKASKPVIADRILDAVVKGLTRQ